MSRRLYKYTYSKCTKRFPEISRDRAENFVACAVCERTDDPFLSLFPPSPSLSLSISFSLIRSLAHSARSFSSIPFPTTLVYISLSPSPSHLSLSLACKRACSLFPSPSISSSAAKRDSFLLWSAVLRTLASVGGLPGAREALCDVAAQRARRCAVAAVGRRGLAPSRSLARAHPLARSLPRILSLFPPHGRDQPYYPPPPTADIPTAKVPPSCPFACPRATQPACLLALSTQGRTRRLNVPRACAATGNDERGTAYRYLCPSPFPSNFLCKS